MLKARALTPILLFAAAFGLRVLPWPQVLRSDGVFFHGNDAYYHMRRVLYALEHRVWLDFDPFINFPHGARAIWPPLFDAVLAIAFAPFYWLGGERALERAIVFAPPLIGAFAVVGLYRVALRHWGEGVAVVSALILTLLSAHFWYSQLGFVDHHAAVAAGAVLLFGATLRSLSADPVRATRREEVRDALWLGLSIAGMLLLWPGTLLHVAIAELCLLSFLLTRAERAAAERFALRYCAAHVAALLVFLLLGWPRPWVQWGAFSPTVLTWFQPWLLALAAFFGALCSGVAAIPLGTRHSARALSAIAAAAGLVLVSFVALPALLEGVADAWQWLAKDEAFQATVLESEALFSDGARIAEIRLSRFIYLLPVVWLGLLFEARNRERRPAALSLLAFAITFALVTVVQRRFFNSFAVFMALCFGWSVFRSYALTRRFGLPAPLGALGLAALCVFLLAPMREAYQPYLAPQHAEVPHTWQPLIETAQWLRAQTPSPEAGDSGAPRGLAYGVMASAGIGHVIEYVARRPTIVDNFGDDIGASNYAMHVAYITAPDEASGSAILDALSARYVVAEPTIEGSSALMPVLFNRDGSGLGRHRLVYESSRVARSTAPRALKVFEHVPGAMLVGCAPPDEAVRAKLVYRTNRGRRAAWQTRVRVAANGRYELRVPHPTAGEDRYAIDAAGRRGHVAVDEEAVREGRHVTAPDWCDTGASP